MPNEEDMLNESSVEKLRTLPRDSIKIRVGYPSVFSPSEPLLKEFNEIKSMLMKKGLTEQDARIRAWQKTDFEKRYRKEIESQPDVIKRLKDIKSVAKTNDVYLYCFCGKPLCPRFILIDMIKHLKL